MLLAACSAPADSGTDGSDSAGGGTVAVTDGVALLSAEDLAFDASTIQAPAGRPFTISFTNNDCVPHNVSVYVEEGGDRIGEAGATINEGETAETDVEALSRGRTTSSAMCTPR